MKAYIGDGVYAEHDGYALTLTTENGYEATNTIVLEPEVYRELARFIGCVSGADPRTTSARPEEK